MKHQPGPSGPGTFFEQIFENSRMSSDKNLINQIKEILNSSDAQTGIKGSDRNFFESLIEVLERNGSSSLTPRQRSNIKKILREMDLA